MDGNKRPNLKRKIREISKDDLPTRINGKLHRSLQEVYQACKKAKTFETQKLVKKLKGLRKDSSDTNAVQEHEAQLTALKELDIHSIARTAFKTKVLKDRTLRDSELIMSGLEKEITNTIIPSPASTPLGKVQSRLLSSKHLSSQISISIDGLKVILDPEYAPQQKKQRTTSAEPPNAASIASSKRTRTQRHSKEGSLQAADVGSESEDSEDDDLRDEEGADDESEDGDGADGWESGSISGDEDYVGRLAPSSPVGSDEENSGSEQDDDDDSDPESDEDTKPMKKANAGGSTSSKTPKVASGASSKPAKINESTFLPSLQVAYISGSDDSDAEAEVAEPRKNRRGQRARRAIWEKKYGRNANHKKAEAKAAPTTAVKQNPEGRSFAHPKQPRGGVRRGPLVSGPNSAAIQGKQRAFGQKPPTGAAAPSTNSNPSNKPLHPSWEAKKKLKEKQSGIVPSQGKKIKF
ncbi:hypothetical protein CC1G_12320 [Coprinopsis cinerea okayama7|uniref:Bud22 domain-containing protein n=1 Tax=Coprinopsis cinerea (strain Okayama-7 / 130 / ATCC MYA-4618 / FGSC 9003) TaxID=240176 RepID=A8NS68_COPC7|nr:hypothetical protein CC1G_12320 [Coprinopsis cinerea okayama7\|eukprot:XP_001835950.2 hypothetical protein CC1G_12320 [Coprinopsis cinerea okayama7\